VRFIFLLISAREGGVSLVNLLFGFSGRINRTQYWVGTLGAGFAAGFLVFAVVFTSILGATAPQAKTAAAGIGIGLLLFLCVVMMVTSWIGLALQWKRFHDRGRPGWVAMAPVLPMTMVMVTIISGAATGADIMQVAASANLWMLLLWAINLFFFIDLGCLPGKAEANQYGNPPGPGFGGGGPRPTTPQPQAPAGATPTNAMSSLFGAQSAMERAIAEHKAAPAKATAARPAIATASATGAAPSFGRRQAR
jgi:uncharacterized membrane protein YhaH (DUF805 family)